MIFVLIQPGLYSLLKGREYKVSHLSIHQFTTNESQEVSPFPAGDHKAHINRRAQNIANTRQNKNIKDPQNHIIYNKISHIGVAHLDKTKCCIVLNKPEHQRAKCLEYTANEFYQHMQIYFRIGRGR